MNLLRRKNRKSNRKKRKSAQFSFEPLEARELLVFAWVVCGCDGEGSSGESSGGFRASSEFEFNADTILQDAYSGKPGILDFVAPSSSTVSSVSVELSMDGGSFVPAQTFNIDPADPLAPNEQFKTGALLPLPDASSDYTNLMTQPEFDIRVTFFDGVDGTGTQIGAQQTKESAMRLVNQTDSVFGHGWSHDDYQFLVDSAADGVYWKRPGGATARFNGPGSTLYSQEVSGDLVYDATNDIYVYDDKFGSQSTFTRVADNLGNPITNDPRYFLASVNDGVGNVTTFDYGDANPLDTDLAFDDLFTITDAFGRETDYDYAMFGTDWRLESIEDYAGRETTFDYYTTIDHGGFLKTVTHPEVDDETGAPVNPFITYTYTDSGKIETTTDSQGVTAFRYDDNQRLVAEIAADGSVTKLDTMNGRAWRHLADRPWSIWRGQRIHDGNRPARLRIDDG